MKKLLSRTNVLLFAKGWMLKLLLFSTHPVFAQSDVFIKSNNCMSNVEFAAGRLNFETFRVINSIDSPATLDLLYLFVEENTQGISNYQEVTIKNNMNGSLSQTIADFSIIAPALPVTLCNYQTRMD